MSEDIVTRLERGYPNFNDGRWEQAIAEFHPDFTAQDRDEVPDPQHFAVVEGEVVHLWRRRDGLVHSLRAFSTTHQAIEAARGRAHRSAPFG